MKRLLVVLFMVLSRCTPCLAQVRPDVCPTCFQDTTGGYISIVDTVKLNPVCNYELLTREHLALTHKLKISRAKIPFFPANIDAKYKGSGDSRGHVIPYEDLAYSQATAKASMNLKRNLAPEPQAQNIGTELASENYERHLADSLGWVKVYAGTWGTVGVVKGINKPSEYWKLIVEPNGTKHCFYFPTTGDKSITGYSALFDCIYDVHGLPGKLGFDPEKVISSLIIK